MSLVSIETKLVRCPYNEKWLKNKGDPKVHAQWYIPTTRTWSNSTYLSGESTDPYESADLCEFTDPSVKIIETREVNNQLV